MIKKILLSLTLILSLGFAGCATTNQNLTPAQQGIATTQTYVYSIGATLKATNDAVEALYTAGKIDKDTYNKQILPVYNQALGSYQLLVAAMDRAVALGMNPTDYPAYAQALMTFLTDQRILDSLIAAFGGVQ